MLRSLKLDAPPSSPLVVRLTVALAIALVVLVGALTPAAEAQNERLTVTVDTTYRVNVASAQIRVESTFRLFNNVPPLNLGGGRTQHRYFDEFRVVIPTSAKDYTAYLDGQRVQAGFTADDNFVYAESPFLNDLYFGEATTLTVSYVIPNSGPRGDWGTAHISDEIVSFQVWTQGDPGKASVRIVLPAGYDIDLGSSVSSLSTSTANGETTLSAYGIGSPRDFNGRILARSEYTQLENTSMTIHSGTAVVLSRPTDTEWRDFIVDSLKTDLPVLEDLIGIPWPQGNLVVEQSSEPEIHGFGGWFNSSDNTIEVGADLDKELLLHEFSHGWFNASFSEHRWVLEGLAEEFASRALEALGEARPDPSWPDPSAAVRVPLNEWHHVDQVSTSANRQKERYHYNASWWLFRQITNEIGMNAFSEVLVEFDAQKETPQGRDYRLLFDLLDDHADDDLIDGLFETYVFSAGDDVLERRRATLQRIDGFFTGRNITVPPILLASISRWHFDNAERHLDTIDGLLPRLYELQRRTERASIDSSIRWRQWELASEPRSLTQLSAAVWEDFEMLDRLEAGRTELGAQADAHNISLVFEPVPITSAESDLEIKRQLVADVIADRTALLEAAAEFGIAVDFDADASLLHAGQDLALRRARFDEFVRNRVALDERFQELGLASAVAPAPTRLPTVVSVLEEQASVIEALANAGVSLEKLSSDELSILATKDQALAILAARQGATRSATALADDTGAQPRTMTVPLLAPLMLVALALGLFAIRSRRNRNVPLL